MKPGLLLLWGLELLARLPLQGIFADAAPPMEFFIVLGVGALIVLGFIVVVIVGISILVIRAIKKKRLTDQ
ncbi:MAG TPA: hypothetical protein PKH77_09880 [Anaerolineae bacterium]|nr:hypothetical protein [Anaerolineae bacterium]